MESILARALEYTLKYWLKSFSRDQFKLQGRTVQLSNLDINGDALHASLGLPPALNVSTARVGKLEIMLPTLNNVQIEPIVVQIDRLDLVLDENEELDASSSPSSAQSQTSSTKGSGYGFADKIADGMTIQIRTVNLLLETRGGARCQGGASWAPPIASITMRNLVLYSTNENWQAVNLKEARDFSNNKKFIYVFKKLEWESLSIDLLPHPDMFTDSIADSEEGANQRDDDGAKRVFFGGERFLEGISGQANITVQRTELNSPLGLEVQLHITEAVSPALSEPGLRALLRFLTGVYVCLNRGDVDPKTQQRSTEAAGCSLVSIIVDHIFLCIKDAEFQLELLMQSLFFSRASVPDGDNVKNLTRVMINGMFLRDIFSRPPCTLVQPSMRASTKDFLHVPDFAVDFCPPIYPLGNQQQDLGEGVPIICFHSLQVKPSPAPPSCASQTVIDCQPLMIHLQEESCLRIASFLADGIMVNSGDIVPDNSINSLVFTLKELDITVPLGSCTSDSSLSDKNTTVGRCFTGARLHIENLFFLETPSVKLRLLNLEKDPACFSFWEGQPVDASQKKWTVGSSHLSLSLETFASLTESQSSAGSTPGLWKCVELKDACIEVAMATADGNPLVDVPPPGGIVRVGISCQQYLSNTSVEQLFFVLDLYGYFGKVSEKIALIGKSSRPKKRNRSFSGKLMEKVPSDTAVSLAVEDLQLRFLESSSKNSQGMPLVQFIGEYLSLKVNYRTLGGAVAVSSNLRWESVEVSCVDAEGKLAQENETAITSNGNGILVSDSGYPQLRAVFWVHKKRKNQPNSNALAIPFLDINVDQMIPFNVLDKECHSLMVSVCISGVRLGGGMNYAEALLHRFGIFGPDGGPGEGLSRGLEHISAGPLSKLFKASPLAVDDLESDLRPEHEKDNAFVHLGIPDDVDASIELKDWLFALEGAQEMAERPCSYSHKDVRREERCWHSSFQSLRVNAKSSPKHANNGKGKSHGTLQYPVDLITVGVEGLQTLKPQSQVAIVQTAMPTNRVKETFESSEGIDLEAHIVISDDNANEEMANWVVENLKFSVKQPIEAVVSKDELQHLTYLCKSEVESMGRIAAGVLRLLKLDKSIGQAAIDQLSNLGTEGFDKIFSSDKLSRGNSAAASTGLPPSTMTNGSSHTNLVSLLEEEIGDSRAKCAALISNIGSSEYCIQHLADIEQLSQKLESMQNLLTQYKIKFSGSHPAMP